MCRYNRYMVELRWASVRAAQSDINEDLHAAELKYTVLNVFNVMVLIIAACLLGLISNISIQQRADPRLCQTEHRGQSLTSALPYIYYNDTCRYYEKNMSL